MRRARLETEHERAALVAAAVTPDNTDSMTTTVEPVSSERSKTEADRTTTGAGRIVTTIERETTGGLQATVDDYVVNLTVAETVADNTTRHINS